MEHNSESEFAAVGYDREETIQTMDERMMDESSSWGQALIPRLDASQHTVRSTQHVVRGQRTEAAFSLVELLVVTSLIVLVLSLVIPAAGRARDQANAMACRANLRSLALGCLLYAGEHDSFLPTDATVDNPHTALIEMLGRGGYVDAGQIYYCPSEVTPELRYCERNFEAGNIGYFYYSFTERPTNRFLSNFLRKTIQWPRILKDTMPGDVWVASDSWFSNAPTAHRYYRKGVNYVTLGVAAEMAKESPRAAFR